MDHVNNAVYADWLDEAVIGAGDAGRRPRGPAPGPAGVRPLGRARRRRCPASRGRATAAGRTGSPRPAGTGAAPRPPLADGRPRPTRRDRRLGRKYWARAGRASAHRARVHGGASSNRTLGDERVMASPGPLSAHSAHRMPPPDVGSPTREGAHLPMPAPRTPRIRARLAGPSGLAAALVLGAAGPASASVHRAAVVRPRDRVGRRPPPRPRPATTTDSSLGAIAVLGACGLAGFLLLILGRRKDHRRTGRRRAGAARPRGDPAARLARPGRRWRSRRSRRHGRRPHPTATATGHRWRAAAGLGQAPQRPGPAAARAGPCHGRCLPRLSPGYPRTRGRPPASRADRRPGTRRRRRSGARASSARCGSSSGSPGRPARHASSRSAAPTSMASSTTARRARTSWTGSPRSRRASRSRRP